MSDNVQRDSSSILCDMCTGEDRKAARKTCMKCEISMCVQHLEAHLTTPVLLQTHPLTEPMAIDGNTKCPQHEKLLEYYCLDDKTCVCVSCAIEDQHRLHNMKTFSTAHKELLEKLKAEQKDLQVKTEDDNMSLEKWEKSEREKLARSSVRLIEAVTNLRDISLTTQLRFYIHKTLESGMSGSESESEGGGGRLAVPEDGVELLGDPDEGRPAAQLLQLSGSDVGAGGAHASQDVSYRLIHRPFVGNFHRLPLRRSAGAKNTKHDSVVAKKKKRDQIQKQ
uniref:B box-type domain-containing protein n=1 Tax=Xiphophorus maculatus TaxID=8083 RepID=A0A3B5RF93_XIPMA